MGNIYDPYTNSRISKVDNYETIINVSRIISGLSLFVYIPIIVVFFFSPKTRVKVIQIQLIIASMFHNFTYFLRGTSTQEYLCITKGMLNLLPFFTTITTGTVIVYVALGIVWRPKEQEVTCGFFMKTFVFTWGIPLVYLLYYGWFFYFKERDYNHPCWINDRVAVVIFFVCCFLSFGANVIYLLISIAKMNQFIKQYGSDTISALLRRKLIVISIWSIICFAVFIMRFVYYFVELSGSVIRDFGTILGKYIFESISGPMYVIIYCYTRNTLKTFFEKISCKRNISHKGDSIEEIECQNNSDVLLDESIDLNTTLY